MGRPRKKRDGRRPEDTLTKREHELILQLVETGASDEELGVHFHLSAMTVKHHLYNARMKLGTDNRVQIVSWYWRRQLVALRGLISMDDDTLQELLELQRLLKSIGATNVFLADLMHTLDLIRQHLAKGATGRASL